jgi:hypothetical protein
MNRPLSLALSPIATRRVRGERRRRLIGELETGGCRHRQGKCRPYGPEEKTELVSRAGVRNNENPVIRRLRTGGMPVPRCGSRRRLSVYPNHQPRRGGIASAGAARPRGFKRRTSIHWDATSLHRRDREHTRTSFPFPASTSASPLAERKVLLKPTVRSLG